ncbi:hypothetical protein GJQ54_11150 [Oceanospirillaceae bacterium ASx5O]|nr:hypothetical protein GJQ54_11150 [Oceanospirillaceae bacterium ASx5O]
MKTLSAWQAKIEQVKGLLGIKSEQAEVWLENAEIVPGSSKDTEDGLHYLDFEYRAVLYIERLPQEVGGLLILLAHQFVNGLGERDGLEAPTMSIIALDSGRYVDVELTFGVRDPVHIVPVENSPIVINGQPMGFAPGAWNIATEFGIEAGRRAED